MANAGDIRVFSFFVFVLLFLTSVNARRSSGGGGYGRYSHSSHGGSHSYPSSTGLSGSGTHSASSGHSYPQSSLSGNGGHTYQQTGNGGHSYPQPGVSNGGHTYPQSTGLSGNNNVQKQPTTYYTQHNHGPKTEVHHHYHYNPPPRVTYGSVNYPVYHSQPPAYIIHYKDSGSRFDNLLTGLALYNLGRMSSSHHYREHRSYVETPGEICKLGVRRSNGEYEETRIDCKIMSSFIWDSELESNQQSAPRNISSSASVVNVMNVTQVQTVNGTNHSVTTVTVTNTTLVNALEAKGKSIEVTPTMRCYMIRQYRDTSVLKKNIKCGVLQAYAQNSWRNAAARIVHNLSLLLVIMSQFGVFIRYFFIL